eukprot:6079477-Prymnesium_polylepis.1
MQAQAAARVAAEVASRQEEQQARAQQAAGLARLGMTAGALACRAWSTVVLVARAPHAYTQRPGWTVMPLDPGQNGGAAKRGEPAWVQEQQLQPLPALAALRPWTLWA